MRTVTELAIANSDLIQLSYDPGKVSTAWGDGDRWVVVSARSELDIHVDGAVICRVLARCEGICSQLVNRQ